MKLTNAQIEAFRFIIDYADTYMSNAGCNDAELPNTPENLEMINDMIAASDYPDDEPDISDDGKAIYFSDFMMAGYCSRLLDKMKEG